MLRDRARGYSCGRGNRVTRGEISGSSSRTGRARMQIYFVDVEGGQATLFVTPEKHSLLIHTGFAGNNGRDSDRIVAAAKKAGLDKIEYVLITRFHGVEPCRRRAGIGGENSDRNIS